MMPGVETVLVDIGLDDGIGLDVDGVSTAVGFYSQCEVGVRIDVPEESAEEPEAAVVVAEGGVAYINIITHISPGFRDGRRKDMEDGVYLSAQPASSWEALSRYFHGNAHVQDCSWLGPQGRSLDWRCCNLRRRGRP